MTLQTLYHQGRTGKVVEWECWTEGADIVVRHGQIGGKKQISRKTSVGKNIGKANETTAEEQAELEATAIWTLKLRQKYSLTVDESKEEVFLPMTAKKFKDPDKPQSEWGNRIVYPCAVQPKLDGVRLMAYWDNNRIVMGTRGGKEWTAPTHIAEALEKFMPKKMVLDGELYLHGVDFETLTSWSKKKYPETSALQFHVFDMPIDENGDRLTWEERAIKLSTLSEIYPKLWTKHIKFVSTYIANSIEEVLLFEEKFLTQGYEGAMVRNLLGIYTFGHQSYDLQKVKTSIDAEFKVIGYEEGIGNDKGCVIWECVSAIGTTFTVRPKATVEKRKEYFANADSYIGKWLKVEFQNYTADGKPRFPRALGFRDIIDIGI